jgi:hypothetical protein
MELLFSIPLEESVQPYAGQHIEYGGALGSREGGFYYCRLTWTPESGYALREYSFTREGDTVTIKTSPVKKVFKQSDGRMASSVLAAEGEYLTEASFKVDENINLIRIRIEDEHGCCAYTQAYDAWNEENEENT